MMNRLWIGLAMLSLMFCQAGVSEAAGDLASEKKAGLMGTGYQIEVVPDGGGSSETDVVSFDNHRVSLASLVSSGYKPSNFTVNVQEDGTVTWMTMQMTDGGDKAFMRGDIDEGGAMSGKLTLENKKGKISVYSFKSL